MAWSKRVVWSEGMFLQPQHFQQQERYLERFLENRVGEVTTYPWGFAELGLDSAALLLGKIVINTGRGVMPDGTAFDFPRHDAAPTALEVPADAKNEELVLAVQEELAPVVVQAKAHSLVHQFFPTLHVVNFG